MPSIARTTTSATGSNLEVEIIIERDVDIKLYAVFCMAFRLVQFRFVYLAITGEIMLPRDKTPIPKSIPSFPPHLSDIIPPMSCVQIYP